MQTSSASAKKQHQKRRRDSKGRQLSSLAYLLALLYFPHPVGGRYTLLQACMHVPQKEERLQLWLLLAV